MLSKILDKYFYRDVATVRRAVLTTIGKTDDYTTTYETIYDELPCRLAQSHERATFHRDDTSQKDTLNYMLYFSPEYDVLENDVVEVRHNGQTFKLFAGTAFKYASHTELQLKRRKEARQQ